MTLGEKIEKYRKQKNLTQQELGNALFVSDKTISSWEKNRTEPSLDLLVKLSEVLDCNLVDLLNQKTEKLDIETEIKIPLDKEEYDSLCKLMEKKVTFLTKNHQIDTYYEPEYRSFTETKDGVIREWLRIGKRGNQIILNYKNWYDYYCDEYEVTIDDAKSLEKIFHVLNIKEIAQVDKERIMYQYEGKYEVSLDSVKKLGYFIEIEVKKYDLPAIEEYAKLLQVAKNLGLNLDKIDKRGYPYYLISKRK